MLARSPNGRGWSAPGVLGSLQASSGSVERKDRKVCPSLKSVYKNLDFFLWSYLPRLSLLFSSRPVSDLQGGIR